MPGPSRPTLRRIELGYELKKLREKAELTRDQAVQGLQLSESKLLRIETGLHDLRSAELLRRLLERYAVTEATDATAVSELLRVQREASSQEWWAGYRSVMPSGMHRFVGIESAAVAVDTYHPTLVPGLLQSESYARALYTLAKPVEETTTEFRERNVELRMRRKDALFCDSGSEQDAEPPRLSAIIYEPALRYTVGSPTVMREQYEEIIQLAGRDNVTIQVLPQGTRGYLNPFDFTLLHLGPVLPTAVQVDAGAPSVTDKPREVLKFVRKFEAMSRSALAPEDTHLFMQQLSREMMIE
ncbi:helix-turn-helix domain-containing protein [Streptomyces bohaiensis]|uniref:Helix-turn-helix domain-containing protein n=1 Tax=Streptomyces bohaiensis TaxID=1431344 RepID=A0ABX1C857_9ACTN|nr:helix-turn-helix transcriptional regulator [Streptomyces bohaiensis]NJQ15233.1 helix-turn-helix domain-containing protein [Streptomyces bohaiensis]